ncbi:hypothetical protein AAFN86_02715 [Roseomonas sp. CAU 1739]|uniref:hypothetical protein n=1 Tax=Roseomonas sp. CAU 1739 TaxID=3140364 RepID=UPI00325BDC78
MNITSPAAEQRRLVHAVAAASDKALAGIVALFDSMTDRQEADRLLDAVRPRLRRLRPPRPITLPRLLFLPVQGVIAEARSWRRQDGGLPRSALVPIAEAVRLAMGAEAQAIEALLAGRNFADLRTVDAAGRRLWQAAAAIAPGLAQPPGWEAAGLAATDFRHAMIVAGGVWRHANPLWAALLVARDGPPDELVRDALVAAATEDPMVPEAILATLLLQAARPGSVVAAAVAARMGAPVADRVLDRWINGCSPDITVNDAQGSARLAEAFAEAMDDLDACPAGRRPDRRQRIAGLRRDIGEACRVAFVDGARAGLLEPMAASLAPPDDGAMSALEGTARALKRLERAGRVLGGGAAYDLALRQIADALGATRAAPGSNPADLARLAEILVGPEDALKLLDD